MQPLHYWESIDYDPTLDEYPHGPHYLCTSCSTKKKPAVLPKKVRQLRASQPIESGSAKRTPAVLPKKVHQIRASKPTKSSVRKNKVSRSAKNKTPVLPEKVRRFCGSWTVTDNHVLPMEAMGRDNDEGFCDEPAVTPVLPTEAMIDDDNGTVSGHNGESQ
jgi:hypothetical protein